MDFLGGGYFSRIILPWLYNSGKYVKKLYKEILNQGKNKIEYRGAHNFPPPPFNDLV